MERDVVAEAVIAWKMRTQDRASVRAIADQLGCSVSTAHARLRTAADAEHVVGDPEDRTAARVREASALDHWQDAVEQHLPDDALTAVPILIKVSAARRALLGLDAPARVNVGDDRRAPQVDDELANAIMEARQTREQDRRRAALGTDPDGG